MSTTTVRDIMHRDVRHIQPTDTVSEAAAVLADEVVGLLLVAERGHLVGVISERDVVRCLGQGDDPEDTHVLDVMTEDVETVEPGDTVAAAAARMLRDEIRHLVVMENGKPAAVVAMRDVVAALLPAPVDA